MTTHVTRSRTNKFVGGVAGGISDTYGWDPTLVRLGFVFLTLTHGIGLLLYVIMWVAIPLAGTVSTAQPAGFGTEAGTYPAPLSGRNPLLGWLLVGLGALMLLSMLNLSGPMIALLLVGAGWYLLRKR